MGWTTPVTWAPSTALSVARLNEQLRDNMDFLHAFPASAGWGWNYIRNGHFSGWQGGAAAAPDCWTLSGAGAAAAQEAGTVKVNTYSAKLTNGVGNVAALTQTITDALEIQLKGQTVQLGMYVYATAASRAFIRVTDGLTTVDSSYHSGAAGWEWLTCELAVSGAMGAAGLKASCQISAGAAISAYYDGAILVQGTLQSAFVNGHNDYAARLLWRQSSAPTNFRLGGGLLMQIGDSPGAAGDVTVTFPVAFSVAPYMVLCVGSGGANTYWVTTVTTAGFVAKRVGSASSGVYWMAIGLE
jgi:hypothetical protein